LRWRAAQINFEVGHSPLAIKALQLSPPEPVETCLPFTISISY
jgi:hypothetical protein